MFVQWHRSEQREFYWTKVTTVSILRLTSIVRLSVLNYLTDINTIEVSREQTKVQNIQFFDDDSEGK